MPMRKNKSQAHQPNSYIYNIYQLTGPGIIYKPQTHHPPTQTKEHTNPDIPKQKSPFQASTSFTHPLKKNARSTQTQKPQQQHEQAKRRVKKQSLPHTSSPGQKSSSRQSRPHETRAHFPCLLLSSSFYGARVLIIVVKGCRLIGSDKKA